MHKLGPSTKYSHDYLFIEVNNTGHSFEHKQGSISKYLLVLYHQMCQKGNKNDSKKFENFIFEQIHILHHLFVLF